MGSNGRVQRLVEPTEDWEQIELLCGWPEQRDYELIRPMVLFRVPAAERAGETGAISERTLQRRTARFEAEGMESLFGSEHAPQEAATGDSAPRRGPQGGVPPPQPWRMAAEVLHWLPQRHTR